MTRSSAAFAVAACSSAKADINAVSMSGDIGMISSF
jgi:hypothetical protein